MKKKKKKKKKKEREMKENIKHKAQGNPKKKKKKKKLPIWREYITHLICGNTPRFPQGDTIWRENVPIVLATYKALTLQSQPA
jgi:hypothetical protein